MTTRCVLLFALLAVLGAAGCGANRSEIPSGVADADQFLFKRGQEEMKEENWLRAREYFRQIVDNYPQSTFRPDAKLAVGDTMIGEDTTESLLLAINEFKEFLTFYPTHPRADYAQFRMAVAYSEKMLAADRDQTATKDVVRELHAFVERYPNSSLLPEARKLLRQAQDRLSESSYRIGMTYYRMKWWRGAIDRFKEVLKTDPEYTRRDSVYYYLAESLAKTKETVPEALPYYDRLLKEFEKSEHLEDARKRLAELKSPAEHR